MGRYTTVQAYADNNPNMRAVDYAQATGTTAATSSNSNSNDTSTTTTTNNRGPVITEKVDNPYGSTAGAGSGEFHVYRHARAREMARWEAINATEAERKAEEEFQSKVAQAAKEAEDKTEKRRRKRERAKDAKRRKKNMMLGGVDVGVGNDVRGNYNEHEEAEDEFEYTPIASSQLLATTASTAATPALDGKMDNGTTTALGNNAEEDDEEDGDTTKIHSPRRQEDNDNIPVFPNDGSFLERMKQELAK